jgi:hypothetical protein
MCLSKDHNGALNIMERCKKLYSKLPSIYAADKFREPGMHRPTAELLVPDSNFDKV